MYSLAQALTPPGLSAKNAPVEPALGSGVLNNAVLRRSGNLAPTANFTLHGRCVLG